VPGADGSLWGLGRSPNQYPGSDSLSGSPLQDLIKIYSLFESHDDLLLPLSSNFVPTPVPKNYIDIKFTVKLYIYYILILDVLYDFAESHTLTERIQS